MSATVSALVPFLLVIGPAAAQEPPRPLPPTNQPPTPQVTGIDEQGRFRPPTKGELFRLESEASLFERIRQQKAAEKQESEFPEERHLTGTLPARNFIAQTATQFASYVVFQPLYFQQINVERYGWELGVFQPVVSTAQFYGDVLMFPYKFAVYPCWTCETNAGYALPGDPEPLRFLTVPFSWRGMAAQAGAAVGGSAIFP